MFDLPATDVRPAGGLLVLTPAHNPSALEAWGQHFREHFTGRRAQLVFEPAADWHSADTQRTFARIAKHFSQVTIALNSDAPSFVETVEMARRGHNDRPFGQYLDLMASLDQLLEGHDDADLVCVAPPNARGFLSTLRYLETKGLSRRSVSGLTSVRHCR